MGRSIRLSDALVQGARFVGGLTNRSAAGQIELGAALGKSIESLLRGKDVLKLMELGKTRSLSECLAEIETPEGQQRVKDVLASGPFPHFEAAPDRPGLLVRIEKGGTRTIGRFIYRRFVEASTMET